MTGKMWQISPFRTHPPTHQEKSTVPAIFGGDLADSGSFLCAKSRAETPAERAHGPSKVSAKVDVPSTSRTEKGIQKTHQMHQFSSPRKEPVKLGYLISA